MRNHVLLISLVLITGRLSGQDWNWPEDKLTAVEKNAMYTDYLADKDYPACVEPLEWLLAEAPSLNPSIYINAVKIYEGMAEAATDPVARLQYQETALNMFDKRIEHFGQKENVMNRKAFSAYKFYKDNPSKYQELMDLFDETFKLSGNRVFNNNLVAFMDVIRRYKKAGGDISDEEVMLRYTTIAEIITFKKENAPDHKRIDTRISDNVDRLLASTITLDCPLVENTFGVKIQGSTDVAMAKKVFRLLLAGKCSDSPLFMQTAEIIHQAEPSYGMAKVLAAKNSAKGDMNKAWMYYEQAEEMADANSEKADVMLDMAKLYAAQGNNIKSRNMARKALTYNPRLRDAYTLIGNLYMNSFEDCKGGVSKVQDRALFIAAYEMYERGGYQRGMENARAQFPSIEEIFELNLEEGQEVTVGCWVNETVSLARRP